MTIAIPDRPARRVQEQASIRRRFAEDIALDILRDVFIDAPIEVKSRDDR